MSRNSCVKLSILLISIFFTSCATYTVDYTKDSENWKNKSEDKSLQIDHTFYLVGDAGNATENKPLKHLSILKNELINASKKSTVLFLGDNLYEKGLPKKTHPERQLAEHRLNAQLEIVKGFKGNTIFIPGNHDYYSDGINGLKRQEKYIIDKLKNKNSFLPKNGCPLKKVHISDDTVLIIVDSQWYLENWDNNPTMNDDCEIKTRTKFFDEFESLIEKNTNKTTIIAIHHPLFSNGSHGGQFSLKKQLFPIGNKVPLPVLATVINLLRKTSGASPQDMINPLYRKLKNRLITLSQKSENIIFVSGHEHNLQYIYKDNIPQIISGSGSKISAARAINGGEFSYGGLGYAKLVVYKNGAAWVSYYTEIGGKQHLLYKTKIQSENKINNEYNFSSKLPKTISASVYSEKEVSKGKSYTKLWGEHYRKYYGTKVTVPSVLLDTLFGGLIPTRKGGGNQSRSLRLEDKNGKVFVMRALRKSATQYLQAVAFKDQYIEGQFENTYTESLLQDIYTAAHPYAPFTIGQLADAVNIFHTNPTLYYIPKQKALSNFNNEFGDELYMIEERATSGHGDKASFGFSNKLISTSDLLKNLQKSDKYLIDEDTYIRARLFDMLIGDWDRHEDQWRWAEFKNGKKTIYKPVPRDRDQAFSKFDGVLFNFATRAIPALKSMQIYDNDIRNVKWFNSAGYSLDKALINTSTFKNWEEQVNYIQKNLNDKIIDEAFNNFPKEVKDETIADIKRKLKGRLKNLPNIAKTYYKHLSKYAVIKGTEKDNWFDIERLNEGKTSIKVYNIKNNKKGSLIFKKIYSKNETSEIWVYGLDDKDTFNVFGVKNNSIPIRIIGGQNNDTYIIENGKRITIYDYKTKKSTFKTSKGKRKLFNNYEANSYNYKKLKYSQNQIIPSIGSNPDDGFKIGINNIFTVYGFERNPFSQQHTLKASYYFANKGFDIKYNAEFANIFNNWNFILETEFTSPNYTINHFGLGNETENFEEDFGEDYHRVKLSTYAASPFLKWVGKMGGNFKVGSTFESIEVEDIENRFINTQQYELNIRKYYAGFKSSYFYENYDNKSLPTLGMSTSLEAGWKTNVNDSNENHTYIIPSISFTHKLNTSGTIVLATKLKGHIIIGNNFEFYNAADIGGYNGLRGYRNQRFIGDKSFYQNSDIRFSLRKVKTEILPLQIGLFGGFDYGRVWLNSENSNDWKTSYGAGFWLVGAEMINLNLSVFNSNDGAYVRFGLGFGF